MYVDSQNLFSDAQAVTSTAISSNVIDLNPAGAGLSANVQDIGIGEEVYLVVTTVTTCTDTGSDATLTLTLESDTAAGLASSPVVHLSTGALAFATYATAGSIVYTGKLPVADYKRYLGLRYTIASGPLTAGAFTAFLTKDVQRYKYYKSAFTVDA